MKKNGKYFKCKICGKKKYLSLAHFKNGEGKYCSIKCRNLGYKNCSPYNKGVWFKSECRYCNKKFINGKKGYIKIFCSKICANKFNAKSGIKSPSYKTGRQKSGNGYIYVIVPNHPFADKRGRILEHRYIMEQYIGRYLKKDEIIDHLNEITTDNRIENLEIVTHAENLRRAYKRKHNIQ